MFKQFFKFANSFQVTRCQILTFEIACTQAFLRDLSPVLTFKAKIARKLFEE